MTNFNRILISAAIIGMTMTSATATPKGPRDFDLSRFAYKSARGSEKKAFSPERMAKINSINSMLARGSQEGFSPEVTFSSDDRIGDIDGPNNELWFYTSSMVYKYIPHEYYVEEVLLEYKFDVYNASGDLVGTIHDKMRYEENEVRVVECSLVPMVSQKFFNDDDKYELMVGLGVNRTKVYADGTTEWMPNSYRSMVYSLGGEKETLEVEDSKGKIVTKDFDKPVYRMEGSLGDVLDASVDGKEEIYLTFYEESLPEYSDDDIISGEGGPTVSDSFWENLTASHITLRVRGKVDADGNMPEIMSTEIPLLSMPGDQENTPFMMSFRNGDESYYLTQYYKDIFYNKYDSPTDDLTMKEHNSLMIDLYKISGGEMTKVSTTEVPFVKDSKDRLLFSFHSVGDFRYSEDINFNEDGEPTFFVTKNNYFADEHAEYSYYHYGKDGKKLNDIFENAQSNMPMTNIDGMEPQQMFVTEGNAEYIFHFVDLLSGVERAAFSCYLETDPDSDPDMMTANIDRTKIGDTYQYAVEMRTPTVDENDNSLMRIGWLDANGQFLKMDEVNMGQYVVYAQCYIDGYCLQKDFYLKDEPNEYMMLIKRGIDANTLREDLLIGQALNPDAPEGRDVLLLTADNRGALNTINPYTSLENPMLHVYYYNQNSGKMALDIYYLPFDATGIAEIDTNTTDSAISYDGVAVKAASHEISIFDIQGKLLRNGRESVIVSDLGAGVYVAIANGEIRKFIVK